MNRLKFSEHVRDDGSCVYYNNARGFLVYGMSIVINGRNKDSEFIYKSSLLISYTGLLLLLKSILLDSADKDSKSFILSARPKIIVQQSKSIMTPGEHTVDRKDLLKRLKTRGFESALIDEDLSKISRIRNEIEHKYTTHPKEVVLDASISIFGIVSRIIDNHASFWGDTLWKELCTFDKTNKSLQKNCDASYKANNFLPHPMYFECLECYSKLVEIKSNKFECHRCSSKINKEMLIALLGNSSTFAATHRIIAHLVLYLKQFNSEDVCLLREISADNNQVSWIMDDPDLIEFYTQLDRR